ncbi:hypothetical protein BX616_000393 [Lobosporangium transversale]|uniref:LETM1-like protein-domain-containing protein n=1 Tax=Lobosporangium transversale TaxID=64571 RepID=A0A1Y2GYD0_9FUNG|nr:LETM1-like protein-domain-containing protein [Lobosporangium transversale]KAF9907522.1 hypothetical protein BX616_000393 [Lobosporangium transversale]ORZ26483.1 LETM1-like protein-domain-containing protein [Lobosporangium transversale]|eukprot:XP_021884248.1 LETM1-like protein-domain-containing protein [Lobosporangium transversale]
MSGAFIRAAARINYRANSKGLLLLTPSRSSAVEFLIWQPQVSARYHAPTLSQFCRPAFYSTSSPEPAKDKKATGYVHPAPAPLSDLTKPISAGTVGSVDPENSLSITATPPSPASTGISGKAKDFFRKGKEIVIQCKDGVKLLWVNKKIVKDLKQAQREEGHQLTRREFQLIHKTDADIKRLIPFGLIFVLATEYIPLIIIFAPQLIPSTCITPSQLEGRRKKIHEKRSAMTEKLILLNRREINKEALASYNSFLTVAKKYGDAFEYSMIDRAHLASFCRFMGLSGFGPSFMLRKRLDKYMGYIKQDDLLLQKEGIDSLTFSELQLANEERGMRSLGVSKEHLEKSLTYWLKINLNKDVEVPPALMVFSRMFLLHSTFKSDSAVSKP